MVALLTVVLAMSTPSAAPTSPHASLEATSSACATPSAPHSLCTSHRPNAAPPVGTILAPRCASSPALISASPTGEPALEWAGRPPLRCAADYDDPELAELEPPPKLRR